MAFNTDTVQLRECSLTALLVATVNSEHNLVTMYKEDGSHWFTLDLAVTQRNLETMTETMKIYYEDPDTGKYASEQFLDTGIPVVPHSWLELPTNLREVSQFVFCKIDS